MRHIVIDTETTGLDPKRDKIVEIGAVELVDYRPTGRTFHCYANPGIPMPADAVDVHGLTDDFLAQFPPLDPEPLLSFLGDAPLVAHNAAFDSAFLQAVGVTNTFIDSLALARSKHPGANCTLDALCKRYGVSTAHRTKHGALLDAELLAAVYVDLVGRQTALDLPITVAAEAVSVLPRRPRSLPARLTAEDLQRHAAMLESVPNNLW